MVLHEMCKQVPEASETQRSRMKHPLTSHTLWNNSWRVDTLLHDVRAEGSQSCGADEVSQSETSSSVCD